MNKFFLKISTGILLGIGVVGSASAKNAQTPMFVAVNDTIDQLDEMEDGDLTGVKFNNYADSTKNALRYLLEKRFMSTKYTFEGNHWYDKMFFFAGGGIQWLGQSTVGPDAGYLTYESTDYKIQTMMNAGIGKEFNRFNAGRISGSYSKGWLNYMNPNGGDGKHDGLSMDIFGAKVEHLYDITSYIYGYRPGRKWSVSTIEGIGVQASFLRAPSAQTGHFDATKWSGELHGGLQIKYNTGAHGYIAIEPYVGIATGNSNYGINKNYHKYVPIYGANLNYIYYFRNNLSPEEKEEQLNNAKYQRYLVQHGEQRLLTIWRTPWFFEASAGLVNSSAPRSYTSEGKNYLMGNQTYGIGNETSFSIGKWISPSLALRGTVTSRSIYYSDNGNGQTDKYGNPGGDYKNANYVGFRVDGMLNPLALLEVDGFSDWDSPYGVNILGGLELGKSIHPQVWDPNAIIFSNGHYQISDGYKFNTFAYTVGAQLWAKIGDDLRAYIEPRYSKYFIQANDQRFRTDGVTVNVGIQQMLRERRFRDNEEHVMMGVDALGHFFLGAGAGMNVIQKRGNVIGTQATFDGKAFLGYQFNHRHAIVGMADVTPKSTAINNQNLILATLNYQPSLSDLMSGYKGGRKVNLDLLVGGGVASYNSVTMPAIHTGLKLTYNVDDHLGFWFMPSLYALVDKNGSTDEVGYPLRGSVKPFETFTIGAQYRIFRDLEADNSFVLPSWLKKNDGTFDRTGLYENRAPWFIQAGTGYYRSQLNKNLSYYGSTLDFSFGKWIKPWWGVRGSLFSRAAIDNIDKENRDYYQGYAGGRIDAMLNVLGLGDKYAHERIWGVNAILGVEYGKYRSIYPVKGQENYSEREGFVPSVNLGMQLWAQISPDMHLFIEPTINHQFVKGYSENTAALRAGITMFWRDYKYREGWVDPITALDDLTNHVTVGLGLGMPLIQMQNREYHHGGMSPFNVHGFLEYHFNNKFAVRASYEQMNLRGRDMASVYSKNISGPQTATTALWNHNYHLGFLATDFQASITELMSGHKAGRLLDLDLMLGPSLGILYGESGSAVESNDYKLAHGVKSSAHFAIHSGAKLTAHVTDQLGVYLQSNLYFVEGLNLKGIDFLSHSQHMGAALQSFNVGVQYDFNYADSELRNVMNTTRDGIIAGYNGIKGFFNGSRFHDGGGNVIDDLGLGEFGLGTPWFVQASTGYYQTRLKKGLDYYGNTLDISAGKWIKPWWGVRLSAFVRSAIDEKKNEKLTALETTGTYTNNYYQNYGGVRLEGMLNLLRVGDQYAQDRTWGLNGIFGLEYGMYRALTPKVDEPTGKHIERNKVVPGITAGLQLWAQAGPDVQVFVEPTASHLFYPGYGDNTLGVRAGLTMFWRDYQKRLGFVDPVTYDDDLSGRIVVGGGFGMPIVQLENSAYKGGGFSPVNFNLFGEYHINNVWGVRLGYEHMNLRGTSLSNVVMKNQPTVTGKAMWDHNYHMGFYNLDAMMSLTEIFSGHKGGRFLDVDFLLGPSLAVLYGEGGKAVALDNVVGAMPDYSNYELANKVSSKASFALHTGAKLTAHVADNVGVYVQPSFYLVNKTDLAGVPFLSHTAHIGSAIESINIGVQYSFGSEVSEGIGNFFSSIGNFFVSQRNHAARKNLDMLGGSFGEGNVDLYGTECPWFIEAGSGWHWIDAKLSEKAGTTLDFSVGKWVTPQFAVRGSFFTRDAAWSHKTIPAGDVNLQHGYAGVRVEAMYDISHMKDEYAQSRKYGVNVVGGLEAGYYVRWNESGNVHSFTPALTVGLQMWYSPSHDMRLFIEPKAAYEITNTYDTKRDIAGLVRAGITMNLREQADRQGWEDYVTFDDDMSGKIVLGAMAGFPSVQKSDYVFKGLGMGKNFGGFFEYHFDNIWAAHVNFESATLAEKNDARYNGYTLNILTFDAMMSLTELFSGHRRDRSLTLDVMAGPGLRKGPDDGFRPHWAIHTGAKMTYNIPQSPIGIFFQPSLFFVGKKFLRDSMEVQFLSNTKHAIGCRAFQTFNVGLQVKL